jgi:hypothetical protein
VTRDEKATLIEDARQRMVEAYRNYTDQGSVANLTAAASYAAVMSALIADL